MKRNITLLLLFSLISVYMLAINTDAKWITSPNKQVNEPNTWIAFRKDVTLDKRPDKAITQIAADSKYWLWINGDLVIFEGGLKRGPNPRDTYYDEIDLAPYLKKGVNKIAVLLWYFGKDGFSHLDSGKAGLIFSLNSRNKNIISDNSWKCIIHPAYGNTEAPFPNFRLSESNIRYDANQKLDKWQIKDNPDFTQAIEVGSWGDSPWNKLKKRIIPLWKDFGIKTLESTPTIKKGTNQDTLIYKLPYNMQMTPILDITDNIGNNLIGIYTDNTYAAGDINIRAEYITEKGTQEYESLGWMNGHYLLLVVPHNVNINKVSYRETGYNSEAEGKFHCDDEFFMRFWEKALRTLYVNMRDSFYDCPERERAQWWGDAVLLMAECFYTHSTETHSLMKKGMLELVEFQKKDGVLFSPIPSRTWDKELPAQILASVGWYGFWNYYMNTGDLETMKRVYPNVKKYLEVWTLDETGLTAFRPGGWTWGDWGDNKDIRLIFAGWHHLALQAAKEMALITGNSKDIKHYEYLMEQIKSGYNKCWNGFAYRHPEYHEKTDDRVQALAVLTGIADESKYDRIFKVLQTQHHASPYMEKYVMESLFKIGKGEYAMTRAKERYADMVNNTEYTTLFEGWGIGEKGFGGGTVNHAWSGGPLINIAKEICGIYPLEPAYRVFKIEPNPIHLKETSISVPSIAGDIKSEFKSEEDKFELKVSIPKNSTAIIYLPENSLKTISINGKIDDNKKYKVDDKYKHKTKRSYQLKEGNYTFIMN